MSAPKEGDDADANLRYFAELGARYCFTIEQARGALKVCGPRDKRYKRLLREALRKRGFSV